MSNPPCADRCTLVAYLIDQSAHDPLSRRAARVGLGLTPEFVPPLAPVNEATAVCQGCGAVYRGPKAAAAARECARADT